MSDMTFQEATIYLASHEAPAIARVIFVPPQNWTEFRQFLNGAGCAEIRLSDLIAENAWLPSPEDVLGRVRGAGSLLGLDGYLALLNEANRGIAMETVKRLVDGDEGPGGAFLLINSEENRALVASVFANPRYRERRQIIEIRPRPDATLESNHPEILLVGDELRALLPKQFETIQSFLRNAEERPVSTEKIRIVVQSDGRRLAGVSANVRQVMNLRDFAHTFHGIDDAGLSEGALRWLLELAKANDEATLAESARRHYFPDGGLEKLVLRVFADRMGYEREAMLWVARTSARAGSYLEGVLRLQGVTPETFSSIYIAAGAAGATGTAGADERREAIRELGIERAEADIRLLIANQKAKETTLLAPWLNCGTKAERAELLRRCAADGVVSKAVRSVYSDVAAYLGEIIDNSYFEKYRELKLTNRVTQDFCEEVKRPFDEKYPSRDSLLQKLAPDESCALLIVDAMGAEWLPMLLNVARKLNLGVESAEIGEARLPTSTCFNAMAWPEARRLPEVKRLDNIVHNGAETHEAHRAEENLVEQLEVVGIDILPKVAEALTHYERVIVTADHGSSRLATLAWLGKLACTLEAPDGAEILDWRYCRKGRLACPPELEETLDGNHWVVRGYDRLPKGGGGGFERHGGGSPEERLVPVVVFSRQHATVIQQPADKPAEFTENDDFDL